MIFGVQLAACFVTLAILALMHFVLTIAAIKARKESGDHYVLPKEKSQLAIIRAHGNFCEMVPISLLLLFVLAFLEAAPVLQIVLCLLLILARALHAYSMVYREQSSNPSYKFRRYGMAINLFLNLAAAIYILELIIKAIVA
jgi:uncharacterized membrane protein YecN with MAPEG domain